MEKEFRKILAEISGYTEKELTDRHAEPLVQPYDCLLAMSQALNIQRVSQQRELLPLFDERHLNNGIAFTLTESGKLGSHPESKLVYETTQKLKKWLLDEFELKKR